MMSQSNKLYYMYYVLYVYRGLELLTWKIVIFNFFLVMKICILLPMNE